MTDTPPSPRASRLARPGWLDGRLLLGVLLVLVSVVVGARILASADRSQLVWAATKDLATGSELATGDLRPVQVRLFDTGTRYLSADGPAPVGYVLAQAVGRGELLPDRALRQPAVDVDYRSVSVPVGPGHFPPGLTSGQKVDVWVTPTRDGSQAAVAAPEPTPDTGATPEPDTAPSAKTEPSPGARGPAPSPGVALQGAQQVLTQITTASGPSDSQGIGSTTAQAVVLQVRPVDVEKLLSAVSLGTIDLVRVPRPAEAGSSPVSATGSG